MLHNTWLKDIQKWEISLLHVYNQDPGKHLILEDTEQSVSKNIYCMLDFRFIN